jgi:hypothetical protein
MKTMALPMQILKYPDDLRNDVIAVLKEAHDLPQTRTLPQAGAEHNIWVSNGDPLLADAEDELYDLLAEQGAERIARLFVAMGLPVDGLDVEKSFGADFIAYEASLLLKGKDSGRNRMSNWIKELAERQKKRFMKWVEDGKPLTPQETRQVDALLKQKDGPEKAGKTAEAYSVRGGFIGKLRNQADREHMDMLGAVIDKFPETIRASRREGVDVTVRAAKKAAKKTRKSVRLLPLTEREAASVEHAAQSAGDKITEVGERHRAAIRQLVMQAKRERWTAQQLASKLFDTFGEQNRDWRRVAITELAFAHNDAFLAGCEEGATVVGMGAVDACKHCRTHVIGKTYTVTHNVPKKETYRTDTELVWVGKSNYKRKVAELRGAIPVHPNCRCRWHVVSRFYKVNEQGKLELKSTAELINEERAKKGLPPDETIGASKLSLEELAERALKKLT